MPQENHTPLRSPSIGISPSSASLLPSLDVSIKPLPHPHTFGEMRWDHRWALNISALSLLISPLLPSLSLFLNSQPLFLSAHSFSAHFERIVDRIESGEGDTWLNQAQSVFKFYLKRESAWTETKGVIKAGGHG